MYQYTFDQETTDKVNKQTKSTEELLKKFNDVDKLFTTYSSDVDLNLDEISYNAPTKDEIETKAKNSLSDYKNSNLNQINSSYDTKSKQIDSSIENIKNAADEQGKNIVDSVSAVKDSAQKDAVKRGLARSSIIVNKLSDYDNKMLSELNDLATTTSKKIDELSNQKDSLELERLNALNSFDIEYAVKLQNKIDQINSEVAQKQEEVAKYNNDIKEAMAKWQKEQSDELRDKAFDAALFASRYGDYGIDLVKYEEKYHLARDYFLSIDRKTAIEELENNPVYEQNLGKNNYQKLLEELTA